MKKIDILVIGSYVQDLAFQTEQFPAPGETRIGHFRMGAGGKGFNQAVAASRQGSKVFFISAVGDDVFRDTLVQFAENEGIGLGLDILNEHSTGAAAILVNNVGENEIIVSLGACAYLQEKFLSSYRQHVENAKVVITQAETSIAATEFALRTAKESGTVSIFNPAPINPDISEALLKNASIITPNETEFRFLLEHVYAKKVREDFWRGSEDELHALCRLIDCKTVILTLGNKGVFVSHADDMELGRCRDERKCYFEDAFSVKVRDTTGAGDAFSGGLAAGLIRYDFDISQAVRYANAVAALSTTKVGTAPSMPHKEEVCKLIDSYCNNV